MGSTRWRLLGYLLYGTTSHTTTDSRCVEQYLILNLESILKIYYNIDEVLSDRRNEEKLSDVVENLLHSPYVLSEIETPFDIVEGLYPEDYVDASTMSWKSLPVELQIKYSSAYQEWYAKHSGHPSIEGIFNLTSEIETKMMLIPPMRYLAGSEYSVDLPPIKSILIKKPSWLGKYEVTQAEWVSVMGDNPSLNKRTLRLPVENMTFEDCQFFCTRTNMRLPHEKVWEMACRAGTTTEYCFGNDRGKLESYAWFEGNFRNHTQVVGKKLANGFGLHDMHGNVFEWCQNKFDSSSFDRVLRGGAYNYSADWVSSAYRTGFNPLDRRSIIGFRIWRPL